MAGIIQIITLILLSLLMMSSSCDKGSEGCTDSNACNYDETAAIDDNSCIYSEEHYNCDGNCIVDSDCSGKCGGTGVMDDCGICCAGDTNNTCSDSNCPECPSGEILGCFGCNTDIVELDCDGVCGGSAVIDDCNQCVEGTTNGSTMIINDLNWEGDNCHYYDPAVGTCVYNWAKDCAGDCFGDAIIDACTEPWTTPHCVDRDENAEIGESWRIKINLISTLKDEFSTPLEPDTSSVIIGASIFATDDWNQYDGGCPNGSDNICYADVPYNYLNPGVIKFYFPHPEWEDIPTSYNTTDIIQDIRENDLYDLFSDGLVWQAKVEPTSSENQIESLSFEFIYLEGIEVLDGIQTCKITLEIDGLEYEVIDLFENKIEVDIDYNISTIKINISDICFQ